MRAVLEQGLSGDARTRAALALLLRRLAPALDMPTAAARIDTMAAEGLDLAIDPDAALLRPALAPMALRGLVAFSLGDGAATMRALTGAFTLDRLPVDPAACYRLSRFAWIGTEQGVLALRSPLSDRWFALDDPALAGLVARFAMPLTLADGVADCADPAVAHALIEAAAAAGMLLPCDATGESVEQHDPVRQMWDFPDLLLHSRSRRGRSETPVGGDYRFANALEPPSRDVAMAPIVEWIDLPPPADAPPTMALGLALAQRRSIRSFDATPLPLGTLSALLGDALRGREGADGFRRPPFPNGGAHYEQLFFLAVDRVEGLPPGLYAYDEAAHRLGRIGAEAPGVAALIDDATRAGGGASRPAALLVIASRFGLVRWKYSGLAYALQLKHVGVVMQTLYLVATALGIGGYAIGTGDTDRFGALAGLDYLEAGAIGEFALGVPSP